MYSLFRSDYPSEINDWVSDRHMFSCKGTQKIKGKVGAMAMAKKYFHLLIKTVGKKRMSDKRFRKEIYTSQEEVCTGSLFQNRQHNMRTLFLELSSCTCMTVALRWEFLPV